MGTRPASHGMYFGHTRSLPATNTNPTKYLFVKNLAREEAKEWTSSVDTSQSCLERLGGVGGANGKAGIGSERKLSDHKILQPLGLDRLQHAKTERECMGGLA